MNDTRVTMVNRVNSASIRVEQIEGEPHLVIPSYTLPDSVVMNGGLYPKEEIDRAWPTINNTLAPIGHPCDEQGNWLSAYSPQAIHNYHGGAYNRNARRDGHRVYVEKVVNIRYALQTEPGKRLLEALRYNAETGECAGPERPIHTSTGLLLVQEPAPEGAPYRWIARNMRLDHDAILLDEPGAATPEQGVGLLVNLSEDSYQSRETVLGAAVHRKYGADAWVRDFDLTHVVVRMPDGTFGQVSYTLENGAVVLGDQVESVQPQTTWVKRVIANLWRAVAPSSAPITNSQGEGDTMPLSEQDLQAIGEMIGNHLKSVTDQITQHGEAIASLKTNTDALAAQMIANAAERIKADRALVAEKHGEAIANALTDEKVTEIANALRVGNGADGLPAGTPTNNAETTDGWGLVATVEGK